MTSGSLRLIRTDPARYRRTPWKNGGGITVDIADEYEPGATPGGWDGMVWRFGRTRIETPAPFSDLPGLDRILTVIGGRGLVLLSSDGQVFDAREPFQPVRFPGDLAIVSELEAGPVTVLNLMAARAEVACDMQILRGSGQVPLRPGTVIGYAPLGEAALAIEGEDVDLGPDEAIVLDAPAGASAVHRSGTVALAWTARRKAAGL